MVREEEELALEEERVENGQDGPTPLLPETPPPTSRWFSAETFRHSLTVQQICETMVCDKNKVGCHSTGGKYRSVETPTRP